MDTINNITYRVVERNVISTRRMEMRLRSNSDNILIHGDSIERS